MFDSCVEGDVEGRLLSTYSISIMSRLQQRLITTQSCGFVDRFDAPRYRNTYIVVTVRCVVNSPCWSVDCLACEFHGEAASKELAEELGALHERPSGHETRLSAPEIQTA